MTKNDKKTFPPASVIRHGFVNTLVHVQVCSPWYSNILLISQHQLIKSMFPATTFCSLLSCHNSDGLVIARHFQRWIQAVSRSWRDMRRHLLILIQDVHDVSISLLLITSKVTMNINNDTSYQEVVSRSWHLWLFTPHSQMHSLNLQLFACKEKL